MRAAVLGHVAELDGSFTPEAAGALESELRALGKDATFHVYPGVDHAFFNEDRPEVLRRRRRPNSCGSARWRSCTRSSTERRTRATAATPGWSSDT